MRIIYSTNSDSVGRAIFIDRDGVINRRRPDSYVLNWSQFAFMPGIRGALKKLGSLGLPIIVISNQSAVGRGFLKQSVLENITARMQQKLLEDGASLSGVYYCTHQPDDKCRCRKPRPDLLLAAAAEFRVSLARSVFIGDSDADAQAARSAGCQPILFGPGLTACSESLDWMSGVPMARTADELFDVTTDSLQIAKQAAQSLSFGCGL